jgi:non-specific serine/threonine protein kinase
MAGIVTGSTLLSPRQSEIAELVAKGLTNKEIAGRLKIAKRTVDAHLQHIFAKAGVNSRVRLTLWLADCK